MRVRSVDWSHVMDWSLLLELGLLKEIRHIMGLLKHVT